MEFEITEQLQAIMVEHIAHSQNGIAVLDAQDRFILFNDAFQKMFELEGVQILGRTIDDVLIWMFTYKIGAITHGKTLDQWLKFVLSSYRSAPFRSFEIDMIDGRWILITEQVNAGGEVVIVGNDITRTKKAEIALLAAQEELKKQALTDELTNISNRRHFFQYIEYEVHRSFRHHHNSCLALLDLDHFKRINDTYGHATGDEVLRHFAHILRSHSRKDDIVGRIGGEEFALLLPETSQNEAFSVLGRIHLLLAQEQLDKIAPGFTYTFSAGIADFKHREKFSPQDWFSQADQALYKAKTSGRNQTMLYLD